MTLGTLRRWLDNGLDLIELQIAVPFASARLLETTEPKIRLPAEPTRSLPRTLYDNARARNLLFIHIIRRWHLREQLSASRRRGRHSRALQPDLGGAVRMCTAMNGVQFVGTVVPAM